ncbi:MAG: MBL fold metallo-hydrolase [Aliishimia sp.]
MRWIIPFLCAATPVHASEDIADKYPASLPYNKPVEVIPGVFSAIGATAPPTYENAGHNNNLSFIVTGDGVVVINGGAAYLLAKALHDEINAITDQPVKLVFDENGQCHAVLGNNYGVEQGVQIVAHIDAAEEVAEYGDALLTNMQRYSRDRANSTVIQGPTETFENTYTLDLGAFHIEAHHLGPDNSQGDIVVWLPEQSLVIAGDMAFHERMLPIFEHTYTADWLDAWDAEFEVLNATYVIPGHGHPTHMQQVRRYTKHYLQDLRKKIAEHLEAGGGLAEAYYVDQSAYAHLDTFEELATRNAGHVFEQMEFE